MSHDEFDDHLRAALRHAPDRDAAPPPALDAHIVEAARRAVRSLPWHVRWARRIDALSRDALRPAPAAALATLALGSVIVLLWRDVPPAKVSPEAPAVVVAQAPMAQQRAQEPAPAAEAAMQAPRPAPPAQKPDDKARRAIAAPNSARAPEAQGAVRDAASKAPDAARPAPAAAPPAEPTAPTTALPSAPPRQSGTPPAPAAAPARADAPPLVADRPTEESEARLAAAAPDRSPGARHRREMEAQLAKSTAPDAPGGVFATLRSDGVVRWQSGSAALAHDGAAKAWLEQLMTATRGRWRLLDAQNAAEAPASALALHRAGRPAGTLELHAAGVHWRDAAQQDVVWQAPLAPEAALRLQQSLAAWTTRSDTTRGR